MPSIKLYMENFFTDFHTFTLLYMPLEYFLLLSYSLAVRIYVETFSYSIRMVAKNLFGKIYSIKVVRRAFYNIYFVI